MSSDSSSSSTGEGNTKPPPPSKKKQVSPAKRWVFTLNNYTDDHLNLISSIVPTKCSRYIVGKEVGESGTPHLQGWIEFDVKNRPMSVIPIKQIHWELQAKNATVKDNIKYCSKEEVWISKGVPKPLETIQSLRPYQQNILDIVNGEPEPRIIYWFYGSKNIGKTEILFKLCAEHNAHILPASKRHALSQVFKTKDSCEIYCLNLTADESAYQTNEMFSILEAIKDRMFSAAFGTECNGMCLFNHKHLVVVANNPPDWSKTQIDHERFYVREINENFQAIAPEKFKEFKYMDNTLLSDKL